MNNRIAFIVGRFQNISLHRGYIHLLKSALSLEGVKGLVIVMGSSPVPATRRNPFTFEERSTVFKDFINTNFPTLGKKIMCVLEQHDQNEDAVWSKNLDSQINELINEYKFHFTEFVEPVLVCSRDSFKSHYSGEVPVIEIEPDAESISSSEAREKNAKTKTYPNESYLLGKLNAIYSQYPKVYPTVDIAIVNKENEILLGRKPRETKWRFPGGFVDPTDENFEAAAKREASEEVGPIELGNWQYVCSYKVDDWRYRAEIDKIMTTFFRCSYLWGTPKASDDLAEVKWFKLDEITETDVFPGHLELLNRLKEFEKNNSQWRSLIEKL